jgi:hypothetical protein
MAAYRGNGRNRNDDAQPESESVIKVETKQKRLHRRELAALLLQALPRQISSREKKNDYKL